jgi:hypothetical protein
MNKRESGAAMAGELSALSTMGQTALKEVFQGLIGCLLPAVSLLVFQSPPNLGQ